METRRIHSDFVLDSTGRNSGTNKTTRLINTNILRKDTHNHELVPTAVQQLITPGSEKDEAEKEEQGRHDQLEEQAFLVSHAVRRALGQESLEVNPEHASNRAATGIALLLRHITRSEFAFYGRQRKRPRDCMMELNKYECR